MSRIRTAVVALVAVTCFVAGPSVPAQPAATITLRVMTFNIWYGGTSTHGLAQVIEAIQLAQADVVGMQEPYARLRRVASALGFFASPRLHVISRYPILELPSSDGDWGYLLLGPGRLAAIANTHLPCCPYTPYRVVNRGMTRTDALRQEAVTRLDQIEEHLDALAPIVSSGMPVFFTGDFNSPSHRDWTRAAVEARVLPYPIRWPVSVAMEEAGFVDAYRSVHRDPVLEPGFTWTPGYPTPYVGPREVFDRIDFVWSAGPAVPLEAHIVGESSADADLVVRPWPSDHRAVVATFDVTPAPAPVFVAAERERASIGSTLDLAFHAPGEAGEHIELVGAGAADAVVDLPTGAAPDGVLVLETAGLEQGPYDLVLRDGNQEELARDTVVLVDDDQGPVLAVADATLEGDQRLEVSWTFGPGNRFDWFGIFRAGLDAKTGSIKAWRYLEGRIDGSTTLGPGARGAAGWPLPPGRYELALCLDDSYRCRTSVPFRVVG